MIDLSYRVKRLSIIVPIYNVENYLASCLDSLINQDISIYDYEIIVIDDGSTDTSWSIANSFINKSSNLRLFSQEHTGVGSARNKGIKYAEGSYLFFMDSDDTIQPKSLGYLLGIIESEKLDLLRFNYSYFHENGSIIPKKRNSTHRTIYHSEISNGETFLTKYLGWACYIWAFIINSSFIREYNLYFNETIFFEDIDWIIRAMPCAKRVLSTDKHIYNYYYRQGSITKSTNIEKKKKVISDKLYIVGLLKNLSQTTINYKLHQWLEGMISLSFMSLLAYVENELPERKNEVISILSGKGYLPLKSYHFTFKQWINLLLINIDPHIYCYLKKGK